MYDYDGDFEVLDDYLLELSGKYGKKVDGTMTDFLGCSYTEIKEIMKLKISEIVPEKDFEKCYKEFLLVM